MVVDGSRYSVWATGWTAMEFWLNFWQGKEIFLFSKESGPGSGIHPTSFSIGTGTFFPRTKVAGDSI
jgi:hypothetical protein